MGLSREFVAGAAVLALAAAAVASPIAACLAGGVGGGVPRGFRHVVLGAGLANLTTYLRWVLTWLGTPLPVTLWEGVLRLSPPVEVRVGVTGGYVNVLGWRREGFVKVVVEAPYPGGAAPYWRVRRAGRVLSVEAGGCSVLVYVPPDAIASLEAAARGGWVVVDLSGVRALRLVNLSVVGGSARLSVGGAANLTLVARVVSGGFEGRVSLRAGAAPSASFVSVGVHGGKAFLHVVAPGYGVRASCRSSGGEALLVVGGWAGTAVNGSVRYETPDYLISLRRVVVSVGVSGGDAEAWVSGLREPSAAGGLGGVRA